LSSRQNKGTGLRAAAAAINRAVVVDREDLDRILPAALEGWLGRDRSLLQAMAFGMLRWHHRLHWQFTRLMGGHRARRNTHVAALLRCGLFQIQFLRVPEHAAVATTVDAARDMGQGGRAGLVNAVLRRYLRERSEFEPSKGEEVAFYSHPGWLIAALRRDWPEAWTDILTANNRQPPMWLRVNRRQATAAQYIDDLAQAGIVGSLAANLPDAVLLHKPVGVDALPGFWGGRVSVQDGAAQLACELMDLEPGIRVLDACAAPGGKTAHMLERCPELGCVAVDRSAPRVDQMKAGLERLGLSADVLTADACMPDDWWDGRFFQRILIDAPCSATGVIRRHPDIKVLRQPDAVARARKRQATLLDRLWPLLAVGGRLVYGTCSVLRAENQDIVSQFLQRTPNAVVLPMGSEGARQILPGEANMDGFYYACVVKES